MDKDKSYGYTAEESSQLYNICAEQYESDRAAHEPEIEIFLQLAELKANENILDLGCGNGLLTVAAKKLVGNGVVVGIDISQKMLQLAKKRAVKGVHLVRGT